MGNKFYLVCFISSVSAHYWTKLVIEFKDKIVLNEYKNNAYLGPVNNATIEKEKQSINGKFIAATYKAFDYYCDIWRHNKNVEYLDSYSCKCGLHKCYQEIMDNKDQLDDWNIASLCSTDFGHGKSALVITKHSNEVYVLHAERGKKLTIKTFMGEMEILHKKNEIECYYSIFKVINNDELKKINPLFYWNEKKDYKPESNDYFPVGGIL